LELVALLSVRAVRRKTGNGPFSLLGGRLRTRGWMGLRALYVAISTVSVTMGINIMRNGEADELRLPRARVALGADVDRI
jgi:hypothetical protein